MGSIFSAGLRDQHFGENGAQGSKLRQENRDQWVPDIPCYDPGVGLIALRLQRMLLTSLGRRLVLSHNTGRIFDRLKTRAFRCSIPLTLNNLRAILV